MVMMEKANKKKGDEQRVVEIYHKIEQDLWINGAIEDLEAFRDELLDALIAVAEKHNLQVGGGFKVTRVTEKELADLEAELDKMLEVRDEQETPKD
jgi:hypothetical protein